MSQINRLLLTLLVVPVLLIGCGRNSSVDDTNKDGDIFGNDSTGNSSLSLNEALVSNDRFDRFSDALLQADLDDTLDRRGPFTVFAPTDEAFDRLPLRARRILRRNRMVLRQVLLHHIVDAEYSAAEINDMTRIKTLNNTRVRIFVTNGSTLVGRARLIQANQFVENGVVHVVDEVLIPRSLRPTLGL